MKLKRFMDRGNTIVAMLCLAFFGGCSEADSPAGAPPVQPLQFDLFLDQIAAAPYASRQALVDSFMAAIDSLPKPFVEESCAVFIYQGNPSAPPEVPGDYNGWDPNVDAMIRIDSTNFCYHREYLPLDARTDYKFIVNGNWILDPLNPRTVTGGFGPNSELVMPAFIDPPEIQPDSSLEAGVILTTNFTSQIMGNTRTLHIYLPPGYSSGSESYPSIYVNDGGEYISLGSIDHVLDYCIGHNLARPLIAVLVDPVNRNVEYWLNDDYRRFIVEELVLYIDAQYRTLTSPENRAIMGASLGGVTSFYIAYSNPEIFGCAGGHSSALWINDGQMIAMIQNGENRPIRFYLDCGTFETSNLQDNQTLRDVLQAKGYDFIYYEFHDGHSWGNWRGHIDNILEAFFD